MIRPQYNYTSLSQFFNFLKTSDGYLEKANGTNLGDFTPSGKVVNAGSANYTVYWKWYKELGYGNMQGSAYCACGVSTMLVSAFGLTKAKKLLCGDLFVYCPTGYNQFKNSKRIYTNPKPGDVVFFYSDSMGRYSHTGWVVGVDSNGKGYTTWEANTSSGNDIVIRNGGATCYKHYTLGQRKVAFGRPDWEGNGISYETSKEIESVEIGTDSNKISCTTEVLNVRDYPSNGNVIDSIKKGEKITPTKKTFVDGKAWYYIEEKKGWASASYFTGWILEKSNNRWWYLLEGYKYYVDKIVNIGGKRYFFDSNGYMFIGTFLIQTDSSGAIIEYRNSMEE